MSQVRICVAATIPDSLRSLSPEPTFSLPGSVPQQTDGPSEMATIGAQENEANANATAVPVATKDDLPAPVVVANGECGEVFEPNKWELFLVKRPCCACWFFFGVSILMAFAATRMLASGALKFESRSVWDVRSSQIVSQRDAFSQALLDSGFKLMCETKGGGPPKPCQVEEKAKKAQRAYANDDCFGRHL